MGRESQGYAGGTSDEGVSYFKKLTAFLFFKYKFIYFNWRLITLQYCIGFAIHQHESATGIIQSAKI